MQMEKWAKNANNKNVNVTVRQEKVWWKAELLMKRSKHFVN